MQLHFLPIFLFFLFQLTFIGTYIAAVLEGHVVPNFPYISDAASYVPESNIFAQLVNIGSVLLGIVIYIRYLHIIALFELHSQIGQNVLKYNKKSVYFGIISCLGISVVGNFQESNLRIVHFCGAFCAFGFGILYFWMQAFITFLVYPYCDIKKSVANIRVTIAGISTVCFVVSAVTGVISHILFDGDDPKKWLPKDKGWIYHVVSAIAEWINATLFCFFILSFYKDFQKIDLEHPQLSFLPQQANL